MINSFSNQLKVARDKFAFVIEHAYLYRARHQDAKETWDAVSPMLTSEMDRTAVELGFIYVTRRHSDQSPENLLARLEAIQRGNVGDTFLLLRARLAHGAVLFSCGGDCEEARRLFDDCVHLSRSSEDHFVYAMACKGLGDTLLALGRHDAAEEAYENALATLRRYGYELIVGYVTNNLAVAKKKLGEYDASLRLLLRAHDTFSRLGVDLGLLDVQKNLGFVHARLGDWKAARKCFEVASEVRDRLASSLASTSPAEVRWSCATPLAHLAAMQRRFAVAEHGLQEVVGDELYPFVSPSVRALAYEFLGELYTEIEQFSNACEHLEQAHRITSAILPESDVMTEVLRRQGQLQFCLGEFDKARTTALTCIRLCRKIGDRYELGAATRILGEVYAAQRRDKRAAACFRTSIRTLKGIHECYELMRALLAQGRFLNGLGMRNDAEVSFLEARQLSKKLELDYYQALIAIGLIDTLAPQERFDEASAWLNEATALRDVLEGIDRDRVDAELKRSANELQTAITRASVKSAETLKTICRVYEDARFPIAEIKPDLAYQVAQSVGAESLWVIARRGGGYHVPITYNISVNDAKAVVRKLDDTQRKALLGVNDEPRVLVTANKQTLVATPCRDMDGRENGYVTCTRFETVVTVTPRQIEILCASAEALARLVDEDDERPAPAAHDPDEEAARARHPRGSFREILTIDPDMIKVIRLAERAATSVAPILLEGETGVGKELFARAIHGASHRKDGAFVAVNAGGMSVSLLESELFGHVKGAFTDARSERVGLVEMAREGTLFLDEIGEMGEEMQVKLLRLLENGEYRRLGESTTRKADVRVLSATNRSLKDAVDQGRFRRDLYYRVSPLKLTIPPLRLRARDIQLMVRHFLRECAAMNGIADRFIEIDVKAMEALELYDWPGNVRELHNEILRVVSLIGKGDLVRFPMLSDSIKDYLQTKTRGDGLLERSVEQYERRLILRAMDNHDWNRMKTADAIGIPRTTLLAKLKRLNVASK